jgi:formyltetrahydrofolate-dependent phosphoribosylglycinamide formyltransferase
MFKKLRARWGVSGLDLLLILCTFALGGSACARLSQVILNLGFSGSKGFMWWLSYILLVTLLWPICVLLISIPLLQFRFFSNYLRRVGKRIFTRNLKSKSYKIKIALFASGAGSNVENFISFFSTHEEFEISLIVCNNPQAGVINVAQQYGKKRLLINNNDLAAPANLIAQLKQEDINFIVLAGFLKKIPGEMIAAFPNKIVNIHPALLPRFGGQGMYGNKVHEAVIQAGESKSGITVHFVDDHYDHGEIVFQTTCDVLTNETALSLSKKIKQLEKQHYPEVVYGLLQNAKG